MTLEAPAYRRSLWRVRDRAPARPRHSRSEFTAPLRGLSHDANRQEGGVPPCGAGPARPTGPSRCGTAHLAECQPAVSLRESVGLPQLRLLLEVRAVAR